MVGRSWYRSRPASSRRDAPVELLDLGEHRLPDLARPERLFQIVHAGLRRDFPRLRTIDAFGGNVPVQLTSFVGRDDDVKRVAEMLDDAPLVTLIGTGGVGKTRLAIQVAAEVVPQFADGAWFCELASADEGATMAQVVAATLGCVQRPGFSLVESIVEYVKVRELLLILDNCEHLLDEAEALADAVVRMCPSVRVLATSREALEVTGERVMRVRSLESPDPAAHGDAVMESAAVQLFADRTSDAGAVEKWTDAQWAAVGEICRRVDGIPLTIELAATRVTSMSPIDIAAHLDERFRLLTGKRRGRVERHQTFARPSSGRTSCSTPTSARCSTDSGSSPVRSIPPRQLRCWATPIWTSGESWTRSRAWSGSRCWSQRPVPTAGLDTRCSKRCDSSAASDWRHRGRPIIGDAGTASISPGLLKRSAWGAWGQTSLRGWRDSSRSSTTFTAAVTWALDRTDPDDRGLAVRVLAAFADPAKTHGFYAIDALAVTPSKPRSSPARSGGRSCWRSRPTTR